MIIKLLWLSFLSSHENFRQFLTDIYNTKQWSVKYKDGRGWYVRRTSKSRQNDARHIPKSLTSPKMMAIMCYVGTNEEIQKLHNHLLSLGWRFSLVRSDQRNNNVYELWREQPQSNML